MGNKRKSFNPEFKSRVVIEALKEKQTLNEISKKYEVHPNQITIWKKQAKTKLPEIFNRGAINKEIKKQKELIDRLHKRVCQLDEELSWLKKKKSKLLNVAKIRALIEPDNKKISITRQCELLGLQRSSYYYKSVPESSENFVYMKLMKEKHDECPAYGVSRMHSYLLSLGYRVNIKRVRRLYKKIGLKAI